MKRLTLILIAALPISAVAQEPDYQQLIETTNVGIMLGLEGAGQSRLISNCVYRVYLTTDLAAHQIAYPNSTAVRSVPKSLTEFERELRRTQKDLPHYLQMCQEMLAE